MSWASPAVAVIVTTPLPTAVTSLDPSTIATVVSPLVHVTAAPVITLAALVSHFRHELNRGLQGPRTRTATRTPVAVLVAEMLTHVDPFACSECPVSLYG